MCSIEKEIDYGTDGILDVNMFNDLSEDDFENLADILFKETEAYSSIGELDFA